jgi:hypothetical protein
MNDVKKTDLPEWVKYVEGDGKKAGIYDLVSQFIESRAEKDVTNFLQVSYGFFSFYTENLKNKATKNISHWDDASLFLLYIHDCMRALIPLHKYIHMSPAAFTVRSILESWITARYIFLEPSLRFSLYRRFEEIEKYIAFKNGAYKEMTEEDAEQIRKNNPEYFHLNNKTKEEEPKHYWTIKKITLKQMAIDVGLKSEYDQTYSIASIFTHCSSILRNSYIGEGGLSPIPLNDQTTVLTLLGSQFGLRFLEDFYNFFGIEFPSDQLGVVNLQLLSLQNHGGGDK